MTFPKLPKNHWRMARPFIVTLVDGDRFPAYPIRASMMDDDRLAYGQGCQDEMWLVTDDFIKSPLIEKENRVIKKEDVVSWEPILLAIEVVKENDAQKKRIDDGMTP